MSKFIGTIYETLSTYRLRFSTKPGGSTSNGQLIEIKGDKNKKYLGRVTNVERKNYLIDQNGAVELSTLFDEDENVDSSDIGISGDFQDYIVGEIEIIGLREGKGKNFSRPRKPFPIGSKIYKASQEFLDEQLKPWGESLEIGKFRDNTKVPIFLDLNELISKHFSVLAMTGSGKSYTVSVILEELAKKYDIPILIFDPHGEYSSLKASSTKKENEITKKTRIYVAADDITKTESDKLFKERFGKNRDSISFYTHMNKLETYQIIHLLKSLYDLSEAQSRILQACWSDIYDNPHCTPFEEIEKHILKIAPQLVQGPSAPKILVSKLKILYEHTPFISKSVDQKPIKVSELVKKGQLTVIDMSGIELIHQQALIAIISSQILDKRMERKIPPVLVVLEEAHRFIPSGAVSTASKPTIKRVAQEGRKFLVGMGIISQRPSRLDDDVLSQCNTQIIMRLTNPNDQNYVKKVSEWVSSSDLDEIKSMMPGEAYIFGSSVPLSLPVNITSHRLTKHGGITPDILEETKKFKN